MRFIFSLIVLLPTLAFAGDPIEDRCRNIVETWQPIFDDQHLNHLVAPPFVLAGDGSPLRLEAYRDRTILASQKALQSTYFDKPLEAPVLILLFESAKPYKNFAAKHLGDDDPPHYGFFRQHDNLMLMNVGTGTGTLVHELVHALISPDFPAVPTWFNEGFASLFEQCSIRDNTITGLPNWRLPALQKAIQTDKLRPLAEMIADTDFYGDKHIGLNYAQARYLMLYLQEKDLLQPYYRAFRDKHQDDPAGVKTLQSLLKVETLDDLEKPWREWVMKLKWE